jgi:exonuclease III
MNLTDIYRTFHPKTKEYTFFSAPHGTFFKIDYIICHKTGLNRYKKIEIIPCLLSDHYGLLSDHYGWSSIETKTTKSPHIRAS